MEHAPLGFLLVDAARLYRARFERTYDGVASQGVAGDGASLQGATGGLTAGEARTLTYANLHPGLRQSALAEKMNVEPMTLVGFLDRLEALGLLRRLPDPRDRRAKIVELTAAAAPFLARIREIAALVRGEALAGFDDAEREALATMLVRIRENLAREARCRDDAREADAGRATHAAPAMARGGTS